MLPTCLPLPGQFRAEGQPTSVGGSSAWQPAQGAVRCPLQQRPDSWASRLQGVRVRGGKGSRPLDLELPPVYFILPRTVEAARM